MSQLWYEVSVIPVSKIISVFTKFDPIHLHISFRILSELFLVTVLSSRKHFRIQIQSSVYFQ